jgi:hypothetical protein
LVLLTYNTAFELFMTQFHNRSSKRENGFLSQRSFSDATEASGVMSGITG